MNKDQKQKIAKFLKNEPLAVVSTVNEKGRPESAVVAFAENDGLEIVFGTSNTSRKYKNIKANQNVSIVAGWSFKDKVTVQYEGVARELSGDEAEKGGATLIAKNKSAAKFHDLPDQRYFLVTPKWIRYSDFNTSEVFEASF